MDVARPGGLVSVPSDHLIRSNGRSVQRCSPEAAASAPAPQPSPNIGCCPNSPGSSVAAAGGGELIASPAQRGGRWAALLVCGSVCLFGLLVCLMTPSRCGGR